MHLHSRQQRGYAHIDSKILRHPHWSLEKTRPPTRRISTTATSLLGLLGIEADLIRSREHILISNIFANAWQKGEDLDLGRLIQLIQSPPLTRIGVLTLDSFYPSKERFGLAMQLNNLLAAPGFSLWLRRRRLDVNGLLHSQSGKPKISIFYIAHLSDAQRMFFVSLLLNQIVGWMANSIWNNKPTINSLHRRSIWIPTSGRQSALKITIPNSPKTSSRLWIRT